MLGIGLYLPEL